MGGLDYGSQKRALIRKKYNAISNFIKDCQIVKNKEYQKCLNKK